MLATNVIASRGFHGQAGVVSKNILRLPWLALQRARGSEAAPSPNGGQSCCGFGVILSLLRSLALVCWPRTASRARNRCQTASRIKASQLPTTMPVQGIDVSYWQGDIDWDTGARSRRAFHLTSRRPKAATISIRNSSTTGTRPSRPASRAAPIISSIGAARPNEQALWFMLNVPPDRDALPPVLDLEWNSRSKTCPAPCVARDRARQDQDHARRDGGAYRQAADHLHRPEISPRGARRRVHQLSFLAALGRRRAGRQIPGRATGRSGSSPPPAACPASPARSTATASTARAPIGTAC